MESCWKGLVLLDLREAGPYSWGGRRVGPCEPALCDELFGLSGISLVLDPFVSPPDDAVEDHSLLRIIFSWAYAGLYGALVVFLEAILEPVKVVARACGGEVVAVNRHHELALWMSEHTR